MTDVNWTMDWKVIGFTLLECVEFNGDMVHARECIGSKGRHYHLYCVDKWRQASVGMPWTTDGHRWDAMESGTGYSIFRQIFEWNLIS